MDNTNTIKRPEKTAAILYLEGNGFRAIARILNGVYKKNICSSTSDTSG